MDRRYKHLSSEERGVISAEHGPDGLLRLQSLWIQRHAGAVASLNDPNLFVTPPKPTAPSIENRQNLNAAAATFVPVP